MKLRNKLILSCAALAAVATTAVSTTFAWYTSNTTVTADGVSGTTKTLDDSTLLISTSGRVGSWGSKVSLGINTTTMVPVEYTAEGGYKVWSADSNAVGNAATKNTDYIQFSLYFKSGSTDNLSVKLTKFNLKEASGNVLNPKMVLSQTGLTQSNATTTYTCNAFRAYTYVEEIGASTEVAADSQTDAVLNQGVTAARTPYDVEEFKTTNDTLSSGCNVHQYYNAVKNLTGNDAIPTTSGNSETLSTSSAGVGQNGRTLSNTGAGSLTGMSPILMITYTIYLDGWDYYCFDACQGQSFTLDMEFQGVKVQNSNNQSGSGSGNGGN